MQAQESYRFVLHPHRSLGARGFRILMAAMGVGALIASVIFMEMGAWPVTGFFAFALLFVYVAFKLNYRSGRLYETVELTPQLLTLTRVHPSGEFERYDFNPYWVRVRLHEGLNGRTALRLASHGRELPFGGFLTDEERRSFADALSGAISASRSWRNV
jgi:uncharacterized membrane protein